MIEKGGLSMDQNSEKFQNIYFLKDETIGELESSAWSGALGRLSFRANVTSSDLEAVSSPANGTSDKSRGGLLEGQCDFKEVLGDARKRLGASSQRRGFLQPTGGSGKRLPSRCSCLAWTPTQSIWNGA